MCATVEAVVVGVEGDAAVVEWGGRRRRAMTLLLPDVQPGERVLVGLGAILGRVPAEPLPPGAVGRTTARTTRPDTSRHAGRNRG